MRTTDRELATVRERAAAYLADLFVVVGAMAVVTRRLGRSRRERVGRARLAGFVGLFGFAVANLYHVVLEGTDGRTVGKRAVGIAVVSDDGRPCTYRAAAIRTAFRFVDWLPAGYLLGFVSIALTDRRRRLGDVAANTEVVRTDGE